MKRNLSWKDDRLEVNAGDIVLHFHPDTRRVVVFEPYYEPVCTVVASIGDVLSRLPGYEWGHRVVQNTLAEMVDCGTGTIQAIIVALEMMGLIGAKVSLEQLGRGVFASGETTVTSMTSGTASTTP
ncbi:hypothetical protein [Halobacterium hubeiense]|uniref:hypothetical protein n=1 Tax=Halobacterium hubeiense TaxID=1407499 RepID=UPI00117ABBC5|nr:hypothetical protein [Halobacterium hubeiense]